MQVELLRKRFRKAVGQCLDHDGAIVVSPSLIVLGEALGTVDADRKAAEVVPQAGLSACNQVRQALVERALGLLGLLPQADPGEHRPLE